MFFFFSFYLLSHKIISATSKMSEQTKKGLLPSSRRKLPQIPGLFKLIFCVFPPIDCHLFQRIRFSQGHWVFPELFSVLIILVIQIWACSTGFVLCYQRYCTTVRKESTTALTEVQHDKLMVSDAIKPLSVLKIIYWPILLSHTQTDLIV